MNNWYLNKEEAAAAILLRMMPSLAAVRQALETVNSPKDL
jgi:hypothetical protein